MSLLGDLSGYDALGMAELVRKGEVTPAELVEDTIRRIERVNPQLNAVVLEMYDEARRTAAGSISGPFAGVPYLMKDLHYACKGARMTSGSRFFSDYVPDYDSELVVRTRRAGLTILGKTNTPEFGLAPITEPELLGPSRNPWNTDRTPGGSSGGAAAAVAARIVPIAHASDGGGSIRIPASCCGLFGLKPTRARTPSGPYDLDTWLGAAVAHAVSISVRDSAALLDATAGPEPGATYYAPPPARPYLEEVNTPAGRLRIAFTTKPFLGDSVDPECVAAVERTAALLQELGHEVTEADPPLDGPRIRNAFLLIVRAGMGITIARCEEAIGRRATREDFERETWLLALIGAHHSAEEYVEAMTDLRAVAPAMASFMRPYDLLMTPTLGQPPIPIGSIRAQGYHRVIQEVLVRLRAGRAAHLLHELDQSVGNVFAFIPFTPLFNITGAPAMSVPLEWTPDGLPIGIQFAAPFGDEATLFRLAAQLEVARPWRDKRPPVCA